MQELLKKVGLDYMDPIEYLIRTDEQYFGDPLFVLPCREKSAFAVNEEASHKTNATLMREALTHICEGDDVLFFGGRIDDSNRCAFHKVFMQGPTLKTKGPKKRESRKRWKEANTKAESLFMSTK